ncbi:MAG: hypothetical protein FWG98_11800 [Candidatus Cloacimonetes bacterium]|nr:hypothetical protein [Candidatus Cloacimonadota bacterium]
MKPKQKMVVVIVLSILTMISCSTAEMTGRNTRNGGEMNIVENGIWIGENATIAIVDGLQISFLRVREDLIISLLNHKEDGIIGVVYGQGTKDKDGNRFGALSTPFTQTAIKHLETGEPVASSDEAKTYIRNHSADEIRYDTEKSKLIYTMYNGAEFELVLAEKIKAADMNQTHEIDHELTIAQRLALWNQQMSVAWDDSKASATINSDKYSIFFYIEDKHIYCRVGQNGFSDKGFAMLSTVCIRANEVRMLENNMQSINDFIAEDEWFTEETCAFPPDGAWYWSVKEVTDDLITLHGCQGDVYHFYRVKSME